MKKLQLENKKDLIKKLTSLIIDGEVTVNDYVTLKTSGSINLHLTKSVDGKSADFVLLQPRPEIVITLDFLPDAKGYLDRIIVNENMVELIIDGLPDVRVPVITKQV